MKYLLFLITFLSAYEVEFNDTFTKFIVPNQTAIFINKPLNIDYNPKFYTQNGVLLLDYDKADEFIRNDFYTPKGVKIEDKKVGIFDIDSFRIEIMKKLKLKYKKCDIKKIVFNNPPFQKIYFKQTFIKLNTKTILECR